MWYVYTVEYYSDMKKDKVRPLEGKCMEEELIMFRKEAKPRETSHMNSAFSHMCGM